MWTAGTKRYDRGKKEKDGNKGGAEKLEDWLNIHKGCLVMGCDVEQWGKYKRLRTEANNEQTPWCSMTQLEAHRHSRHRHKLTNTNVQLQRSKLSLTHTHVNWHTLSSPPFYVKTDWFAPNMVTFSCAILQEFKGLLGFLLLLLSFVFFYLLSRNPMTD